MPATLLKTLPGALAATLLMSASATLASAPPTSVADEGADGAEFSRQVCRAFTTVARSAMPAVVSIRVQRSVEVWPGKSSDGAGMELPDALGEEFFKSFFKRPRRPRRRIQIGQGSGFLISPDGLILTNHHVVGDAHRVTVRLHDGREFEAKPVGADERTDLAVIRIDGTALPHLELGDSGELEPGEFVMAIGSPFGLVHTVTVGVVSAVGRSTVGIQDYEDFIQTDAAINPGNSGGPLLNLDAKAVGINTAIFTRSGGYMGIGFAIPINMAKNIKDQLVRHGRVTRGYLGVVIQEVTDSLAKSFGLEGAAGALVSGVVEGGPADKGGVERGDIVTEFDGRAVGGVGELRNLVAATPVGKSVKITVFRNGRRRELTVEVGRLREKETAAAPPPDGRSDLLTQLGLGVEEMTPEIARHLGHAGRRGVVIVSVQQGSVASAAGLEPGMIVEEVNRERVTNTSKFMIALSRLAEERRALLLVRDKDAPRYVVLEW
ncbi:MAG: DegQ family serine endoprotease [Planctomycetota bacterium]